MFGLGDTGNNIYDKLMKTDIFNTTEKAEIVKALQNSEKYNDIMSGKIKFSNMVTETPPKELTLTSDEENKIYRMIYDENIKFFDLKQYTTPLMLESVKTIIHATKYVAETQKKYTSEVDMRSIIKAVPKMADGLSAEEKSWLENTSRYDCLFYFCINEDNELKITHKWNISKPTNLKEMEDIIIQSEDGAMFSDNFKGRLRAFGRNFVRRIDSEEFKKQLDDAEKELEGEEREV